MHVVGVQPQALGTPVPPQVLGGAQAPQSRVPPQPSAILSQSLPCAAQVVGVQLPPPHVVPHIVCASDTQVVSHDVVQQNESALHTVVAQL